MSGARPGKYCKDLSERRKTCLRLIRTAGEIGITEKMLQRKMCDLGYAVTRIPSMLAPEDMIYEELRRRHKSGAQWETWYVWCGTKEEEE